MGDWQSSGNGELFRFARNPWFLRSTPEVHYCIDFDTEGMSLSKLKAQKLIEEAIQFWQNELQSDSTGSAAKWGLGTQRFVYSPKCNPEEATDLTFKFGANVLTEEEKEFIRTPQRFVGVAIQKAYDQKKMRGQGLIYISADRGPFAYQNSGQLIDQAWQHEGLLKQAIAHELGHIFGFTHQGSGLMSEVFMDQLLHQRFHRHYRDGQIGSILQPPQQIEMCSQFDGSIRTDFFGLEANQTCVRLTKTQGLDYRIEASTSPTRPFEEVGLIRFLGQSDRTFSQTPSMLIYLPEEQEVFGLDERFLNTYLIGPLFPEFTGRGAFFKKGSLRPHHLHIQMKADFIGLVGNLEGQLQTVFSWSPPTLLRQQIPL